MHEKELKNMVWSPDDYLSAAVIAREAGCEMLARLNLMTIKPKLILDAGCATGEAGRDLQALYPQASVIALDHSELMLKHVYKEHKLHCLHADAARIPLKDQSADMIFANLLLPWESNVQALLREWRRVLREEGLLLFSTLGPDTLKDYRQQFGEDLMVNFMDMHDIGDLLLQCGFSDPVLDVSYITLSYQDPKKFVTELCASGMLRKPVAVTTEAPCQAAFEVVYGHAFVPEAKQKSADGVTYIPVSHLRRHK